MIESGSAFAQNRLSENQFDARVSRLNNNSSRHGSGNSAGSATSSFQRSHFAQSKPRYSIASDFVKPMRLRQRQSGNEQYRSISTSNVSRGNSKRTLFFI